jgi:hypothetical protein
VAERQMGDLLSKIRPYTDVLAQHGASADRDSRGG